jgi:hypothetical protein
MKKYLTALIIGTTWLLSIAVGYSLLHRYENTPMPSKIAAGTWPADSTLVLAHDCPTLIMFAHPQCPCTRASLDELSVLITRCPTPLKSYVLFLKPPGTKDKWERTSLWLTASRIPGVTVLADSGGIEASRFSATTSGQTYLFDVNGSLLFNGGITQSRGQFGDSVGLDAVQKAAVQHIAQLKVGRTFGCSLIDDRSFQAERVLPWQ